MILPELRQDVELLDSRADASGHPTWLLHDSSRNTFYRIQEKTLHILALWKGGCAVPEFLEVLRASGTDVSLEEITGIADFLVTNHLAETGGRQGVQRLILEAARGRQTWWQWLVTRYLYIKIPLVRPDAFLTRTLHFVRPFLSRWADLVCIIFGIAGLFFVSRQWDVFRASLIHFFSWDGLFWFGFTLGFLKLFHELGHAYTAKGLGCRVPSMGIAFLVLYPFLYTDTTDSWRLASPRDRLRISFAGIRVEMGLAMLATFFWNFLSDGMLRSGMFFVATAGWISSLAVNLSPFMRFDGYYILGDLLEEENLQARAFALGRHRLRELLFGYGEPLPEILSAGRYRIFLIYAWCTWVYRFFLFIGIAFIVYHLFFKVLGILLFAVEIWWFLMRQIVREIYRWWTFRRRVHIRRVVVTGLCFTGLLAALFVPWQCYLVLPAMHEAIWIQEMYSPEEARLESFAVSHGQWVKKGEVLAQLSSSLLDHEIRRCDIRMNLLTTRIDRYLGSERDLKEILVLQEQLATELISMAGLQDRRQRLVLMAPMDGKVCLENHVYAGQWVSARTRLLTLVDARCGAVTAYVQETDVWRILSRSRGRFLAEGGAGGAVAVETRFVGHTAVDELDALSLASIHGGSIAVRSSDSGHLRPEKGWYRMELVPLGEAPGPMWSRAGTVRLEAIPTSPAAGVWRFALGVLIRESGF